MTLRTGVRFAAIAVGLLLLASGMLTAYVAATWNRRYDFPFPTVSASSDPEVIRRGEYLVFGAAHCPACHASQAGDFLRVPDGERMPLVGGVPFSLGPLGVVYPGNLTPDLATGIGRYTDGQVARLLRYGVLPDGRAAINATMPYGDMSDDDLRAIVSYLRSQPPIAVG